jgi:hypothetical protein
MTPGDERDKPICEVPRCPLDPGEAWWCDEELVYHLRAVERLLRERDALRSSPAVCVTGTAR